MVKIDIPKKKKEEGSEKHRKVDIPFSFVLRFKILRFVLRFKILRFLLRKSFVLRFKKLDETHIKASGFLYSSNIFCRLCSLLCSRSFSKSWRKKTRNRWRKKTWSTGRETEDFFRSPFTKSKVPFEKFNRKVNFTSETRLPL